MRAVLTMYILTEAVSKFLIAEVRVRRAVRHRKQKVKTSKKTITKVGRKCRQMFYCFCHESSKRDVQINQAVYS